MNKEQKTCQNCKKEFTIESEDFVFYDKMAVPAPTWCPRCRTKRRMIFWNQRQLFRKKEIKAGKEIFSAFPPESAIKIYDREFWWTDGWDPMDYGREYDFNKPFFEQFKELIYTVPWPSRAASQLIDSDYCNNANNLKNCYLCFDGNKSEGCIYGVGFSNCKDSADFYQSFSLELCYEMFASSKSYECFYSIGIKDCHNVWFSRDCVGCQDCFGCTNLKNKQYYILNVQYTKEEYEKRIKAQKLHSYKNFIHTAKQIYAFWKTQPNKYMQGIQNYDVIGEYISNSKNVHFSYMGSELENVKYTQALGTRVKDSMDYTNWGEGAQQVYESVNSGLGLDKVLFCSDVSEECSNLEYCMSIGNSSDLFGCVGLRKDKFCIFNKQYTAQEYKVLRDKIIKHMNDMPYIDSLEREYKYGEFFPPDFSPFAYNESTAGDFYPLEKSKIEDFGASWRESNKSEYTATIKASEILDDINELKDDLYNQIIECSACKKAYRVLEREVAFLKRYGIPLPRLCVDCRYKERLKHRNPLTWWERQCMCNGLKSTNGFYINGNTSGHVSHVQIERCLNTFKTSFEKEAGDVVYCESCYQAEII